MQDPTITNLDHDVLFHIFCFLTAADLESGIGLTCRTLHQESRLPRIWRELCKGTGKLKGSFVPPEEEKSPTTDCYYDLYHRIPCVPVGVPTISQAIEIASPGTTITILPGVYHERLVLDKPVRIRSVDPVQKAAIVWYQPSARKSQRNQSIVEVTSSCMYTSLQNLIFLHFSKGNDIWNGNCAIYCHGDLTHTHMDGCSIQSDSGRGVVVTGGASIKLSRSTIHDCAATGLYVGDSISLVDISGSNILRNGFGPPLAVQEQFHIRESESVQAGHSGLYIENAEAEIRDTLVADNSFTGLSVVRQGMVHISNSHIVGNGEEPILVFQEDDWNESMEGTVFEYSNFVDDSPNLKQVGDELLRHPQIQHDQLTMSGLLAKYR